MSKLILAGIILSMALAFGCAAQDVNDLPVGLPPEVPNYAGATVENFWDRYYSDDNPHGGYVMPAIDPATAIIVDGTNGDDGNAGTLDAPFRTIARGIQELKPGAVLLIREGTYILRESLTVTAEQSGTPEEPVLISGYPGETAILTAAEPVAGWRKLDGLDVWTLELGEDENAADWTLLFVEGAILPSVGQAEYMATGARAALNRGNAALEEPPFVPEDGAWGIHDGVVYIRPADGKTPDDLNIEAARNGAFILLDINRADNVIINRLRLERAHGLIRNGFCNSLVVRHCILRQSKSALTGSGKDAVDPMFLEHSLMESNGWYRGRNIYNLSTMNLRYNLFRDMPPQGDAITVYTSTANQFHNVHITGNTFLNTGACIYLVSGSSSVRHNIVLSSRFVSSSGKGNVVEGNFVVMDTRDAGLPDTPRREVGFRMYADGSSAIGNTFIGFDRGMLVRQISEEDESLFRDNRFFGYTEYGVFLVNTDRMRFVGNLFAPADDDTPVAAAEEAVKYDLEAFEALGIGEGNVVRQGAEAPPVPRVIRDAMER